MQRNYNNVGLATEGAFAPDASGFNDTIFATRNTLRASLTLRTPDLNDTSLHIDGYIEITDDPTGATGWTSITSQPWQGGSHDRQGNVVQPVLNYGPTTEWPPFERLRLRAMPSRTVTGVDVAIRIL